MTQHISCDALPSLRSIIKSNGFVMNKSLGQHFLLDTNFNNKIVRQAGSDLSGAVVLEIGAGIGSLTRSIIETGPKRLIAIEYDKRFIPILQDLAHVTNGMVEVMHKDAMEVDIQDIVGGDDCWIVANLPYNISIPLMVQWLGCKSIKGMVLMLQKEPALRVCAEHNSKYYGRVSVLYNRLYHTRIAFDVKCSLFYPPPKVQSSVVIITPKSRDEIGSLCDVDHAALDYVLRATFGFRRKMLKTSLKSILPDAEHVLEMLGIDGRARPENLSIEQFCALASYVSDLLVKRG